MAISNSVPQPNLPGTLGELRSSDHYSEARIAQRTVKDEMRENLIRRLRDKKPLFRGIVGYEDTVVPQVANAILSRQNFILLGLRGQAKSRILRALTGLLDMHAPFIAGCEIRDNPYKPLCRACKDKLAALGETTPIAWMTRDDRYVEKLATPDVTVADLIGDLDPIKAARGGHDLASEFTMHYGLLPRANRGIFAVNELPDLAGKIQVALFNILQEGDIQIKGYPVRLALDVSLVFSANPEDYTARGKIVTPLKDRIGSEIRTHYASSVDEGIAITQQEAWTDRGWGKSKGDNSSLEIPHFLREIVEQIAFMARDDRRVDKKSGVSQRLPISTLELIVSNAERRALTHGESLIVPRISDIYAALPGITGKIELEYEGELRGADMIVREILRSAVAKVYQKYFSETNTQQIEQYFHLGGSLQIDDTDSSKTIVKQLNEIQGLIEKLRAVDVKASDSPAMVIAASEFMLEGLYAQKKLSRTEERGFSAPEKVSRREQRQSPGDDEQGYEDWQQRKSGRRGSFN